MIGFAIVKESAPASLAGTATGVANMGNMLGGMLMPPLVGWVLDRSWSGALSEGVRIYDFAAYRAGFSPMLAWLALALLLLAFTRETHCADPVNCGLRPRIALSCRMTSEGGPSSRPSPACSPGWLLLRPRAHT